MPPSRPLALALALALLASLGFVFRCPPFLLRVRQDVVHVAGFLEPHTPGSGAPEEVAAGAKIEGLLGAAPQLNRVTTVRTVLNGPANPTSEPEAVLILIPGFLGGATTFDPLARDLAGLFLGRLEVWAVDRRPNQIEDRLGGEHALTGVDDPACTASPPAPDCSLFQGTQFYFPDGDFTPLTGFGTPAGPEDLDVDTDGILDPGLPLVDDFGVLRGPILFGQDDVRGFMAHWGLDTYFRDWRLLVEEARQKVGPDGIVLLGGHSQGTTWATTFAAYDFDPDPAVTLAGHELIDGLVLLEGGGAGPPDAPPPDLAAYQAAIADLETPGGGDVFLESFSVIDLLGLAQAGEVGSIAAFHQPGEPALAQRTAPFGGSLITLFIGAPATNRALVGFFLDDDFSLNGAFRASMGFSDDGGNTLVPPSGQLIQSAFYSAQPNAGLRTWKEFHDPTLPSVLDVPPCNEAGGAGDPGCAIVDNGPPSLPGDPEAKENGLEREVTDMDDFLRTQFGAINGFEWYFASGRPFLDFSFGRDSSALVAEHLAVSPGDEGPLVITQNAAVDVPVICIGGSNGLTPEPRSFESYLGSIATPPAEQEVHILPGYAHLDPLTARRNEAVPLIAAFVEKVLAGPPAP